jgi:hypothetical protein
MKWAQAMGNMLSYEEYMAFSGLVAWDTSMYMN